MDLQSEDFQKFPTLPGMAGDRTYHTAVLVSNGSREPAPHPPQLRNLLLNCEMHLNTYVMGHSIMERSGEFRKTHDHGAQPTLYVFSDATPYVFFIYPES